MKLLRLSVALTAMLAILASTAVAQPPAGAKLPPTDVLAWVLGTNLGLAAAVHEAGTAPKIVEDRLATCDALAEALGTKIPKFPERSTNESSKFSAEVLHYILNDIKPIGDDLQAKHSTRHAKLFEIGIKSSVLAIMYAPGDEAGLSVAKVIEDRGKECKLPAETWKPLVDAIRGKKSYDDVKKQLFAMHDAVRNYLLSAN